MSYVEQRAWSSTAPATTIRRTSTRRRSRSTTRIRTRMRARRSTTRLPAHGRTAARLRPYGGAAKRGSVTTRPLARGRKAARSTVPTVAPARVRPTTPATGSYAHGSAAWGPDGARATRAGTTRRPGGTDRRSRTATRTGAGARTVSGPNQTVHTQSRSNAQGRAGSFIRLRAKRAPAFGRRRQHAGAVKTAGGDVYAGADGNVYKKTDDGWEKYDNGRGTRSTSPLHAPDARPCQTNTRLGSARSRGGLRRKIAAGPQDHCCPDHGRRTTTAIRVDARRTSQGRGGGGFRLLEPPTDPGETMRTMAIAVASAWLAIS